MNAAIAYVVASGLPKNEEGGTMKFWITPDGSLITVSHHSELFNIMETYLDYARRTNSIRCVVDDDKMHIELWQNATPDQVETINGLGVGRKVFATRHYPEYDSEEEGTTDAELV